jgi:hypothetical protein
MAVHHGSAIHLVLFPGEDPQGFRLRTSDGRVITVTTGHIYVLGGHNESYLAAAGPPPGAGYQDRGGHSAGVTPKGHYTLGPKEHHTTQNWPMSVVPWGAPLRLNNGEVEYQVGKTWHVATGPRGTVTQAQHLFNVRDNQPDASNMLDGIRRIFVDDTGKLRTDTYNLNDFGKWAWNLKQNGARTAYYLHTTPDNENSAIQYLFNSHGCVHIFPPDRDDMMQKGYLREGTPFKVMDYGLKGPPK